MRIFVGVTLIAAVLAASSAPALAADSALGAKMTTGQMMARCKSDPQWCMQVLEPATKCAPEWMTGGEAARLAWQWISQNRDASYPAAKSIADANANAWPGPCAEGAKR